MALPHRRTHLGVRAPSRTAPATASMAGTLRPGVPSRSGSGAQQQQRQLSHGDLRRTETSMRVMVRVRGTASTGNSVLVTEGARGERITVIQETQPSSSRTKTYAFDHVLSAEADQNMVYTDAVGSLLDDVLLGYNCTVFAYGQTGTGKTHTMEGDLASYMETYAPEAGVIPRTLYRLFHVLESRGDDYAVKMSLIELYNEELRDLLGDEHVSTQLRMYDDPRGRGVVLQGLEEVPLTSAAHGLSLLRYGSERRHVASTLCNHTSSRSHCVFTLTVQIKDTGARGEELMRIGKLNLVDLAGSESIGRSGAENKRAREAGAINQSLLTLGRVINALVDGSTHVPYRESRLTRLLQDSLGGRAKTCIIATVSDDRENLDETLSTLDYASRAKSIKNRPEANQRMTRTALLREYVTEIDRLRSDLVATRARNGIFVSEDNWARMETEQGMLKRQVDEYRRAADVAASRLTSMQEQLEQNTRVLAKREADAVQAETKLRTCTEQAERDISSLEEQLARRADVDAQTRTAMSDLVQQLHEARFHINACAGIDIRQTLSSLSEQVQSQASSIQNIIHEYLTAFPALDKPAIKSLAASVLQLMTQQLHGLYSTHMDTADRMTSCLETHTSRVSDLLYASEQVVRAWDQASTQIEQHVDSLTHHANDGLTRAQARAALETQQWNDVRHSVQLETESLRKTLLSAIDSFALTQDERLERHLKAAKLAEHAAMHERETLSKLMSEYTSSASDTQRSKDAATQHLDKTIELVRTSGHDEALQWDSHRRGLSLPTHATLDHIVSSTRSITEPMETYVDAADASSKAATQAMRRVQGALNFFDARAVASSVRDEASILQTAMSNVTDRLEQAIAPLATDRPREASPLVTHEPNVQGRTNIPLQERPSQENIIPAVTPLKRRS